MGPYLQVITLEEYVVCVSRSRAYMFNDAVECFTQLLLEDTGANKAL
jgi:hypothetical protein